METTGTEPTAKRPKVFISYSHDSHEHSERVQGLGASLSRDGCKCRIDVYKDTDEDWPAGKGTGDGYDG